MASERERVIEIIQNKCSKIHCLNIVDSDKGLACNVQNDETVIKVLGKSRYIGCHRAVVQRGEGKVRGRLTPKGTFIVLHRL